MKKLFVIAAAVVFAGSVASCKKCSTCTVKDEAGATFYTYPEVCGKKKDIETYENNCKTVYASGGYTCDCK